MAEEFYSKYHDAASARELADAMIANGEDFQSVRPILEEFKDNAGCLSALMQYSNQYGSYDLLEKYVKYSESSDSPVCHLIAKYYCEKGDLDSADKWYQRDFDELKTQKFNIASPAATRFFTYKHDYRGLFDLNLADFILKLKVPKDLLHVGSILVSSKDPKTHLKGIQLL